MNFRPRKKRVYTSMYDPFREHIEKCCDSGMTIRQTFETFPAGYTYGALYDYIRKHKIREGAWKRNETAKRVCDQCEYCKKIKNVAGKYNVADNRLCTLSWRLIQYSVRHCPTWCEYGRYIEFEGKENFEVNIEYE